MDIYHTGKEDPGDDHKFVNERLLEVAVPEVSNINGRPIQLEDCLENYFNNRVEVMRHLKRSNTLTSVKSSSSEDKPTLPHIEVKELENSAPDTPLSPGGRARATSIIRRRLVQEGEPSETSESDAHSTHESVRKGSIRKEVLMPAWQFFNLIRPSPIYSHILPSVPSSPESPVLIGDLAWYTAKSSPTSDADVVTHFSQTRPVLGICLKRYAMSVDGHATRQNTFIDIPLDIRLPHFIQDDMVTDDGPLIGNFKLSLQSVICHRGNSVHSGHYISFVRDTSKAADGDVRSSRRLSSHSRPPVYPEEDKWIKFDDLAPNRVSNVDIEQALRDEMPYLLFYQVQPTFDMHLPDHEPPSYTDSGIEMRVSESSPITRRELPQQAEYFVDTANGQSRPTRQSTEIDRPRRSINLPDTAQEVQAIRRGSVANTEVSVGSTASFAASTDPTSAPVTPVEESTAQRMSRAAARFTKSANRSRASSQNGENRISSTFARLVTSRSREMLNGSRTDSSNEEAPATTVVEVLSKDDEPVKKPSKWAKLEKTSRAGTEKSDLPHEVHHHPPFPRIVKEKGKGKEEIDRECAVM